MNPEAMAAFEAKQKATAGGIKTDVQTDRSVKAWIETMNALNTLLAGVTDGATAKAAAPKARKFAAQLESQAKALVGQGSKAASIEKHRMEMGMCIVGLGTKCTGLAMSDNKEISEPLGDVLTKILRLISD